MKPLKSLRWYTVIFLTSLLLVAALVGYSNFLSVQIVNQTAISSQIIKTSERQRMLLHKLVSQMVIYVTNVSDKPRAWEITSIHKSIAEMKEGHTKIIEGDPDMGISHDKSESIDAINFDPPYELDKEVRLMLYSATETVSRPWDHDLNELVYYKQFIKRSHGPIELGMDAIIDQLNIDSQSRIADLRGLLNMMTVLIIIVLLIISVFVFLPILKKLAMQTQSLVDLAMTDPLTGCHNRRSFMSVAENEFLRFQRYQRSTCVVMFDIDKFKSVNDTYGHSVGDEVIKEVAASCLGKIRESDTLGRIGGEEFAIVLPETLVEEAIFTAEKIREHFCHVEFNASEAIFFVTSSFGVSEIFPTDVSIQESLNRADEFLYVAKQTGRNKVVGPDPKNSQAPESTKDKDS